MENTTAVDTVPRRGQGPDTRGSAVILSTIRRCCKRVQTRAVTLALVAVGMPVLAQEVGWRTSDDTRGLPLPPRDMSEARVLVLKGGTLVDGRPDGYVEDSVLVIRGDRIVQAGASRDVSVPEEVDEIIDADGLFVLPGPFDLHRHFTQQRGDDFTGYRDSDVAAAIRGTLLLSQFLDAGITGS